jgi:hypothetical protein
MIEGEEVMSAKLIPAVGSDNVLRALNFSKASSPQQRRVEFIH